MLNRTLLFAFAALLAAGFVGWAALPVGVAAQAAIEPAPESFERPTEVPADILESFVKGIKETEQYKAATALPVDKVEAKLAEWKTSMGVELRLVKGNFIETLLGGEIGCSFGGSRYWMGLDSYTDNNIEKIQIVLYGNSNEGEGKSYIVPPGKLSDFSFDMVQRVQVLHKLHGVIPAFNFAGQTLTHIVANLAGQVGADYAIRSDLSDATRLTLKLSNRTLADCLNYVCHAAGWELFLPGDPAAVGAVDIAETFANREYLNLTAKPATRIATPMDALHWCVSGSVDGARGDNMIRLSIAKSTPPPPVATK